MDDDDRRQSPPSEPRPTTPQRVIRKVPGSFDDVEISPAKGAFDESLTSTESRDVHNPTHQSLKAENVPSLPPPKTTDETSFADGHTFDDSKNPDALNESAVRAHLQDVESSFMAPLSPLPTITANGVDDTYLFDRAASRPPPSKSPSQYDQSPRSASPTRAIPPATLQPNFSTNRPHTLESAPSSNTADVSNTTASLENLSSSPTAAAAARTITRAISSASAQSSGSGSGGNKEQHFESEDSSFHLDHSFAQSDSLPAPSASLRRQSSGQSLTRTTPTDAGSTPGQALRAGRRPKYLRSRNASQRSSTSSFLTNPESQDDAESDVTVGLGVDYALQSGGAVPALGMPRSLSNILSRSISMGSMASGIEDLHESGSRGLDHLETLDEDDGYSPRRRNNGNGNDDLLKTPRPSKQTTLNAPTDTVIARHVRNVQVPESLAKEYKFKSGLVTPRKPSDMTVVGTARSGKNLTLKEQSSTIERLSKENFDLKLKVMFLSDRLDKLSEEGVKEMISENVELKTSLAVIQRDNKVLRRRVKELEKQLKEEDERPGTARSGASSNGQTAQSFEDAQEREEELLYLRERVEEYVVEIEKLKHECINKEAEKRKLSDVVRSLGERSAGDSLGRQEEADVWKDLLEQETARREQADDDNRRLRDEMFRLKQEITAAGGMHHTTNIYNITKKPRSGSPSRPTSGLSGDMDGTNGGGSAGGGGGGTFSTSSTLVEELRRESEQLRHENAELRREVGAQTSMLTSRNREKERLYQEIEDLKMAQRRGGPAPSTVDSILERSASRAGAHHQRSHSRASGATRITVATPEDPAREELENQLAELRDKISEIKLQNQELQRELDTCMEDFETAVEAKRQAEEFALGLQEDLETSMNDLVALQAERDDALREQSDMENEFESLRKEAQEEINALEGEADQRNEELQRLQLELNDRSENFDALQEEMRKMSDALLRLEDEQDNKLRRIQQLEEELGDANKELEELDGKLAEANEKSNRLGIQQESSQGEIAFLREEQEADKIRIGDLEAALANAEQSIRDEKDRVRELDQRLATERRQREIVANREKEEVQQFVNELNREASAAKDESRKLRKALTSREVEAAEWKERLMELENNLREALGDLNGTRSSLLKSIARLQRQLEDTERELNATKASLVEKDRIIKQRDGLLESHGLESRKLAELLDKERQAHRTTRNQHETFQKTHQHMTRTVSTQDARIAELEASKVQAQKKLSILENNLKDQLTERNNLLLLLWTRLSTICGSDWAHDNSLINGRALPSLESVSTMLPGFQKNLLAAVKTIEGMVGGFQGRIKGVEKDLWREYHSLESNLEMRTKKLERLETMVRSGVASGTLGTYESQARMARLEEVLRQLKVENATLRTANDVRARAAYNSQTGELLPDGIPGSPSPSVPTGPLHRDAMRGSRKTGSSSRAATMARSSSSNTVTVGSDGPEAAVSQSPDHPWMLRLREMERKLKAEREARNQDRNAARQRLGNLESENRDLRAKVKRASDAD